MIKIVNTSIFLTRADSAYITLEIVQGNGEVYTLQDGDVVRVHVRTAPNTGELLFEGKVEVDADYNLVWHIYPEDTKDLEVKTYYYDAQIELANGDVFTFIPASKFKLTDEVTMKED